MDLKDFATDNLTKDINGGFTIDCTTLCKLLAEAEERDMMAHQMNGSVQPPIPASKKRRRTKTPPEELQSEDEKGFEAEERRVRQKAAHDDPSYHKSSTDESEG